MIPQLATGMGGMMAQQPLGEQPKPRAGMFGAGSGKPDWVGAIQAALNGFLAARGNPVGMMGLQQMQMARQQAMQEQQRQQQRGEDFEDWVKKQAWAQANRPPVNNDTVADFNFITQQLGPDAGKEYLRNRANPPRLQFIQGVGLVDVSQMGGQQTQTGPVGKITPIDGGPTPPASGGFL